LEVELIGLVVGLDSRKVNWALTFWKRRFLVGADRGRAVVKDRENRGWSRWRGRRRKERTVMGVELVDLWAGFVAEGCRDVLMVRATTVEARVRTTACLQVMWQGIVTFNTTVATLMLLGEGNGTDVDVVLQQSAVVGLAGGVEVGVAVGIAVGEGVGVVEGGSSRRLEGLRGAFQILSWVGVVV